MSDHLPRLYWIDISHDFYFSSRRRHTSWPRDWSSDVCSSDLRIRPSSHRTDPRPSKGGLNAMFRRKRKPSDFGAEIEAHIQHESERLREQGLSEEEARAAARRSFGNVMQAEERFYEFGRWLWWDYLRQDFRFG